MRLANLITGAALAVTSVVFMFWIIPAETVPGDEGEIAPALLPMAAMTVMGVLGAWVFVSALWRRPGSPAEEGSFSINWPSVRFFFAVAGLLFGALAAVEYLGFIASGALIVIGFALFLERNFKQERWIGVSVVLVAATVPVTIYFLASYGLRLSLP